MADGPTIKGPDELYKFVNDYFMQNQKHNLTKEEFYQWLASYETKDLQRLSELEIKLNNSVQEINEVKNHVFDEEHYHRKFDSFFYRTILPKVGEIVDREKARIFESIERIRGTVNALDNNTVKKSNVTKYIGAAAGVLFAGGVGSTWNALFDMQQKLDTVPVLSTAVEGLQEKQREYERNFFVIDGASTTLKDRVDTFEKNQLELKTTVSDQNLRLTNVESSVEDVFGAIRSGGGPGTLFP
jgi:hypothetical protein